MTFVETLLTADVTVATVLFLLLPILSGLRGEGQHIPRWVLGNIKMLLYFFMIEIMVLLAAMVEENLPLPFSGYYYQIIYDLFVIIMAIAFFISLLLAIRIGYRLISTLSLRDGSQ